jgi:hypothetical protein
MSLDLVNTFATLGTFSVIAATAIAAIVQLRHMRGSNQIAALNELRETTETAEFRAAQLFVQTELSSKLRDPAFRYQVANTAARTEETKSLIAKAMMIGNFYEGMGVLVKNGLVDAELAIAMWWWVATNVWGILSPFTAIARRVRGVTGPPHIVGKSIKGLSAFKTRPPRRAAIGDVCAEPWAEVAFEIVAWVVRWAEPASLPGGLVGRT